MDPTHVFVMQPYSEDHSDTLFKIIEEELPKVGCVALRADKSGSGVNFRLQDRIDDNIKKADICIADITSPRNENVLLEVGAALALQIPVVIVSSDPLPSDISNNLYININPKDLSKESACNQFRGELQQRMREGKSHIGYLPTENFVAHGYPDREGVDLDLLIRRVEKRIYVLTTNLSYVVSSPLRHSSVSEQHPHGRTILHALVEELPKKKNSGFVTRILALDPDSNFTNERADSLLRSRREFREEVRQNLDELTSKLCNNKSTNAEIKIYNEYPLQMTFFFDDIVVNSAVAGSTSSRHCVTYVHNLSYRSARNTFEAHFDQLWGRAKPHTATVAPKRQ